MATQNYEAFYPESYSSLNPDFGNYENFGNFLGYRFPGGNLSSTTSIQTANQLNEVVSRIKEGVKNVELQSINPDTFEQIPKQQFKEIAALMKLTGVRPSVHAPLIDAGGFDQQKGWLGEEAREDNKRRMWQVFEKAHELDNSGKMPIVFHSAVNVPGPELRPDKSKEPGKKGRFKERKIVVIDPESGQLKLAEEKTRFRPGMSKEELKDGRFRTAQEEIDQLNYGEWDNQLTSFSNMKKDYDAVLKDAYSEVASDRNLHELMKKLNNGEQDKLTEEEQRRLEMIGPKLERVKNYSHNSHMIFDALFEKAYKQGDDEQKKKLAEMSEQWKKDQKEIAKSKSKDAFGMLKHDSYFIDKYFSKLRKITDPLEEGKVPRIYRPVEEFALEKSTDTYGGLAFDAYKKYKEKAPIMALENMYQGMAFSRASDLKKMVEETRKKFIEKLSKSKKEGGLGLNEKKAEKIANEKIGVTWDVGHLNMMRKAGFTKKDIEEETKEIAPYVKHVHLTDNFGYSDSHLAPGMGNVPFKEILETLEKEGKLKDTRAVIEAGALVNPNNQFKQSPFAATLKAFGSGIYGAKNAPYWNQVSGMMGGYSGFPMAYLPEKHFSTYGSGFSSLPEELGGQIPGTQSRFSGTSNA